MQVFHYFFLFLNNTVFSTLGMSEGRMQAYGWSLPARYSTEGANGSKGLVSVPVPIYCRPLNINEPGMKVLLYEQLSHLHGDVKIALYIARFQPRYTFSVWWSTPNGNTRSSDRVNY